MTLLLAFGERGNAAPFRGSGWSLPEADLTWSIGTHSTLLLPVPSGEGELLLEIHVEPFTSPEVPGQLVIVSANGTNLGHAVIVDESVLSVPVPHAAFAGAARIEIVLHHPDAASPLAAGLGEDDRELALAFHSLQLARHPGSIQQPTRQDEFVPGCGRVEVSQATCLHLAFGEAGNAEWFQRQGWSAPEDRLAWSVGPVSRLLLPAPISGHDLAMELHIEPQTTQSVPGQRLIISVNDIEIFRETMRAAAILSLPVPPSALANARTLDITFTHPDAISPASDDIDNEDDRELAFAFYRISVEPACRLAPRPPRTLPPLPVANQEGLAQAALARTGLALEDLALSFESLGHNCEFAFVQGKFGAEPDGLLRWTGITQPGLLLALRRSFTGIADPDNLEVTEIFGKNDPVGELIIHDKLYDTETHTALSRQQAAPNIVLWQAQRRFARLYHEMLETLRSGAKICVFQAPYIRTRLAMEPVAAALARLGPNTLLWVTENSGYPSGSVTTLQPGMLMGAIDRLAPETAVAETDLMAWGSIMTNAYALWQEALNSP